MQVNIEALQKLNIYDKFSNYYSDFSTNVKAVEGDSDRKLIRLGWGEDVVARE